jgi:pimeloyl-ACP methyl ester carboxylesterase
VTIPATGAPLVLLQHFRGNLDNWDPALTDALAAEREIIVVDYPGVGSSTGEPSHTIAETARQMITFTDALELTEIDLLGFSIGGFVAQELALVRPWLVRRLVLAATGPKGAPGMHGWREDIAATTRGESNPQNLMAGLIPRRADPHLPRGPRIPLPVPGRTGSRDQRVPARLAPGADQGLHGRD